MRASRRFPVPPWLLALDAAGALLITLGLLAAFGVDLGLPALAAIWPLLVMLGLALMAPLMVWVVRRAYAAKRRVG